MDAVGPFGPGYHLLISPDVFGGFLPSVKGVGDVQAFIAVSASPSLRPHLAVALVSSFVDSFGESFPFRPLFLKSSQTKRKKERTDYCWSRLSSRSTHRCQPRRLFLDQKGILRTGHQWYISDPSHQTSSENPPCQQLQPRKSA